MTSLPDTAPETLSLQGDLTASEVAANHYQSLAWLRKGKLPAVIDLAAVTRIDSSALALLLEWHAWASTCGAAVEFRNPPAALRTFASLSEASDLLGWAEDPMAP